MILQFITGLYFLFGMNFQSCNDPQFPYDYSLEFEMRKKNSFYVSLEKQRLMDEEYVDYEVWLIQRWKFLEANAKTLRLDGRDVTVYQIDLRGVYKNWSAGIGEYWENVFGEPHPQKMIGSPSTRFFFGKKLDFEINFFLFPLDVSFNSDISTSDFINYNHEENLWLTFDLISFLDLYVKASVKDFGYLRWSQSMGIKLNL